MDLCQECKRQRERMGLLKDWDDLLHCHHGEPKEKPECEHVWIQAKYRTHTFSDKRICLRCGKEEIIDEIKPEKPKCWCDYPFDRRNNWNVSVKDKKGFPGPVWDIECCPVCGRRL